MASIDEFVARARLPVNLALALVACSATAAPSVTPPPVAARVSDSGTPAFAAARLPAAGQVDGGPSASGQVVDPLPPVVAESLSRIVAERDPSLAADAQALREPGEPSVRVREIELAANGPSALLVQGGGRYCRDANCALGIFEWRGSELRPVLLAMSSADPQIFPLGVHGRPGLVVNHIDGPHLLRAVLYRWDGVEYKAEGCTQFDRETNAKGRCERADPQEAALYAGSAETLCKSLSGVARAALRAPVEAPLIDGAFLLRRNQSVHVQGVRVPASRSMAASGWPGRLVGCLRRAGFKLRERPADLTNEGPTLWRWESRQSAAAGPARVRLGWAESPRHPYAVVTFGIFLGTKQTTVSFLGLPPRSAGRDVSYRHTREHR